MNHGRDYQKAAVDAVFTAWESKRDTILDICTGGGKTVCFAEVCARAQPKKVLVLAHRRDLIFQAVAKIEKFAGLACEIEMGEQRAHADMLRKSNVVVSSIQSQTPGRRMDPSVFDVIIIDEFHHAKEANKSYMDVINHYRQNPNTKFLGVTATLEPECLKVFPDVCYRYDILRGIDDGYLVNVFQQLVQIGELDYSHVRTTAGDLNGADLAAVVENEKVCQGMIQASLEAQFGVPINSLAELPIEEWGRYLFLTGTPKRNLIFTASVAQAKMMSDIFNRVQPGMSAWVCGDTKLINEEDRLKITKQFHAGELLTVANCAVWGEGFDSPGIGMVTMAAATKSKTRYMQRVGRGTRTLEGLIDGIEDKEDRLAVIAGSRKSNLLVLDFVGDSGRHSLVTSADIMAEGASEEVKARAKKKAEKSGKPQDMSKLLTESEEELKLEAERREQARKARLVAKTKYIVNSIDPFERLQVKLQGPSSWEKANGFVLTEKQRSLIRTIGADPDQISVSCGRKLIAAHFNRGCSEKQAKILKRFGYSAECSCKEASKIIDAIVSNGWKRPPDPEREAMFAAAAEMGPPKQEPVMAEEDDPWR